MFFTLLTFVHLTFPPSIKVKQGQILTLKPLSVIIICKGLRFLFVGSSLTQPSRSYGVDGTKQLQMLVSTWSPNKRNHYGQITVDNLSVFAGTSLYIDKMSVLGCNGINKLSVTSLLGITSIHLSRYEIIIGNNKIYKVLFFLSRH